MPQPRSILTAAGIGAPLVGIILPTRASMLKKRPNCWPSHPAPYAFANVTTIPGCELTRYSRRGKRRHMSVGAVPRRSGARHADGSWADGDTVLNAANWPKVRCEPLLAVNQR